VPGHAVTIDWVTVGDPGNACDVQPPYPPRPGGCFGSVDYVYLISKYEVTNAQYAEFLNAVADTDTNGLYSESMGTGFGGESPAQLLPWIACFFLPFRNTPQGPRPCDVSLRLDHPNVRMSLTGYSVGIRLGLTLR